MAGAIWGAYRGESALPRDRLDRLEGEARLRRVAGELLAAAQADCRRDAESEGREE
jgi:ADP-ribosylglycohydrolase